MKYYTNLDDMISKTEVLKQGKYYGFTFILIGGSSYHLSDFNKVDFEIDFYKKFKGDAKYPHISFQKNLSKISSTFSFVRPIDILNHNLYNNKKNDFYITSKKDMTPKRYASFIYKLLKYNKIKPPYVFVSFSEGCWDTYAFIKYYPKLVKQVFFIDGALIGKYFRKYEIWRGNKEWMEKTLRGEIENVKLKNINNRDELIKVDEFNYNIKYYNFMKDDSLLEFNKSIPLYFCWARFHWFKPYSWKDYKSSPIEVIKIKKDFTKMMINKNYRVKVEMFSGPHQIERVVPNALIKYIKKNILH